MDTIGNVALADVYLNDLQVQNPSRELLSKGGALEIHNTLSLRMAQKDDGHDALLAECVLELKATGVTDGEAGEKVETIKVNGKFTGLFVVSEAVAKEIESGGPENQKVVHYLGSLMYPAIRHYFSSTLDLLGIAGFRLPWQLDVTAAEEER